MPMIGPSSMAVANSYKAIATPMETKRVPEVVKVLMIVFADESGTGLSSDVRFVEREFKRLGYEVDWYKFSRQKHLYQYHTLRLTRKLAAFLREGERSQEQGKETLLIVSYFGHGDAYVDMDSDGRRILQFQFANG